MSAARIAIDDDIVDFARALSQLGPWQTFEDLYQEIASHHDSNRPGFTPEITLFVLSPAQMKALAETFDAPTPEGYSHDPGLATDAFVNLQYILATQYGRPFSLADQRNGSLVHDLFPMEKNINRPHSSLGARKDFGFHTDQAYNSDRSLVPRYVSLACIRNNEEAVLLVTNVNDVIEFLSGEARDQLTESNFAFHRGRPSEELGAAFGSVLSLVGNDASLRIGTDTTCDTADAQKAFDELVGLLHVHADRIVLRAGEVCIFNNNVHAHSRSAFEPDPIPHQRRWIQRLHIGER
jgi:hypothetical protein